MEKPSAELVLDIQVATNCSSAPESQLQPRTAEQSAEELIIQCKIHLTAGCQHPRWMRELLRSGRTLSLALLLSQEEHL